MLLLTLSFYTIIKWDLNIQVASLKDTLLRKDMEIEQLQLVKVKAPNLAFDRNGVTKNTVNQPSQLLSGERVLKASDRVLLDPQSYVEVNGDSGHSSPTDAAPVGLGEVEYEEDASDDGLSAGETENSTSDRTTEMAAERMYVILRLMRSIFFHYVILNQCFLSPSKDDYLLLTQLLVWYC
jgi:kinesin family member C2/C3